MIVDFGDIIDLRKIAYSGQCFRVRQNGNLFTFTTGDNVLNIKQVGTTRLEADCSKYMWDTIWADYFDSNTKYSKIVPPKTDKWMTAATEYSQGIRILHQDPWETLISFIISQRKSIPSIMKSVEEIAVKLGKAIGKDCCGKEVFSFPNPQTLCSGGSDALIEAKLGYRIPYVLDAANKVSNEKIELSYASTLNDQGLIEYLQQIRGVGIKVATCTALFAYERHSIAPIDTWIQKIIAVNYSGKNPFIGRHAGIFQQYAFYYKRNSN